MQITSKHLESARDLLQSAREQLSQDTIALDAARTKVEQSNNKLRDYVAAYDSLSASFVSGSDLSDHAAEQFPQLVQDVIGYVKPKVEEKPVAPASA